MKRSDFRRIHEHLLPTHLRKSLRRHPPPSAASRSRWRALPIATGVCKGVRKDVRKRVRESVMKEFVMVSIYMAIYFLSH